MENQLGKNIARYLLFRFSFDGEPITNLKMQKLLYYVYVWYLIKHRHPCFEEKFQAWPIGPVLPSVYDELKQYRSSPIGRDFIGFGTEDTLEEIESNLKKELGEDLIKIVDGVYEKYGIKSAFELVNLTHNESPWRNAREGLNDTDVTDREIEDGDILEEHGSKE